MAEAFYINLIPSQDRYVMKKDIRDFLLKNTFAKTRIIQNQDMVSEIYERSRGLAAHIMFSLSGKPLRFQETLYYGGLNEATECLEPVEKICDLCLLLTGSNETATESATESAALTVDFIRYLNKKGYNSS